MNTKQFYVALILLLSISESSLGCSCGPINRDNDFERADNVVLAKLIEIDRIENSEIEEGKFKVVHILKGTPSKTLNLSTNYKIGYSCGVKYIKNSSYILFLKYGQRSIDVCGGNNLVNSTYGWYSKHVSKLLP